MKAAVLEQPNGKMKIEMLEIPKPKAGEVLVKTHGMNIVPNRKMKHSPSVFNFCSHHIDTFEVIYYLH